MKHSITHYCTQAKNTRNKQTTVANVFDSDINS